MIPGELGGRILDPCCPNHEDPSMFRAPWNFWQSVVASMRGNGDLIFKDYFEGLDMVRATINEELESRLVDWE